MATSKQAAPRVLGASAIITRLQEALDNYPERVAAGTYANIPVDIEAVRSAVVLLGEMCATKPDPQVAA